MEYGKFIAMIESSELQKAYYSDSDSFEWVDKDDNWYNQFGQEIRPPQSCTSFYNDEYDFYEGYTPFGDE